ncbi:hypothetical protein [uncultured Croceitalea sp.]|uniref:hypothetical protein n=1 Tax=uncultured Croceitalea sp. TaxID=1798908 RepID=UPI003305B424
MKNYVITLALITLLGSCNSQEKNEVIPLAVKETNFNYEPTVLAQDTTKLFIGEGDINSDTVLIIAEGGPHNQLYFDFSGRTVWSALPDFFSYYRAHIHQANTLNPTIYHWKNEFTEEMAELEVNNEVEILNRTIKYFKDRNKKVIVAGTSWGAMMIPYHLTTSENQADKYLISAGRLDPAPLQVKYHLKGYNSKYLEDGKTLIFPDTTRVRNPNRGEYYHKISRVKQFMKGVLGKHKFTEELADMDLSNVIFAYATNDPQIGALTENEIKFLKSKGVPIYTSDGGHAGPDRRIIELVKDGTIKL